LDFSATRVRACSTIGVVHARFATKGVGPIESLKHIVTISATHRVVVGIASEEVGERRTDDIFYEHERIDAITFGRTSF
jgi:hypothetical protein